jgi:hypothetical protein
VNLNCGWLVKGEAGDDGEIHRQMCSCSTKTKCRALVALEAQVSRTRGGSTRERKGK